MDIEDIRSAQDRIRPYIKRTRLEFSETLSTRVGAKVFVKYELFQKTGSFKARGAFNKLLLMTPEERSRGVVAVSGGNHAQAVAYAATLLGIDPVIVMPESTPKNYVAATLEYGATVILKPSIAEAFNEVRHFQQKGRVFLHPFDDPEIMAGQGTVGAEIIEDLPDTTDIIVSIGGGGLAGGVATAVKSLKPDARIWGVETVGANAMSLALEAGHPVELAAITSIAKTLGAPHVSELTLGIAQKFVESVTLVSDSEALDALRLLAERLKVITEPAASCTLAAADKLRKKFTKESYVVLILCGGNISIDDICRFATIFNAEKTS
ncbi:threonine/serine dehydratase [soil metagenome]